MNKIVKYLANKAICAAFVALGALVASAELVKTPILQTFEDENGTVTESVGYKVTGLENGEVAMVYTNHERTATWTVPATLNNVQFLVVGGGGGGGGGAVGGIAGAGGGGGGVVTGGVKVFSKGDIVSVEVGDGGEGGVKSGGSKEGVTGRAASGGDSIFKVNGAVFVTAYGGGGDGGYKSYGVQGGSNSGGRRTGALEELPKQGVVSEEAKDFCYDIASYGHPGGVAKNDGGSKGSGGGGGAMGPGNAEYRKSSQVRSGAGGPGLECDITGEKMFYGAGGGGGASKDILANSVLGSGENESGYAYEGGGHGAVITVDPGDGKPNQGGGGGGGSGNKDTSKGGGNGGSGIVVFRYVEPVTAVAQIGDAEYASLGEAITEAADGATITVLNDIATDAAFEITKKVAINLNGKTIATTEKDTEGNGVFWVKSGGELTLNGEGMINGVGGNAYNIAIWADGGKVTINGGTYTNEGAQDDGPDGAHFDLIYAKNGGSVEINGGTFKCQTPNWTLNSHDTAKGTIVVNCGTFYGFNPANCTTEGANTNFCADGLCGYVVETVDGVDFYGVTAAVAQIGKVKFASLDAAIVAAGAEDEVVVVADIATDAAFEITKKVAINLNGKTIATTEKDTEGNGVFWVKAGGELTLNGEGTVNGVGGNAYNIAIWADGGKVIINGGTYTNVGAQDSGPDGAHFDLIYAKNGGSVEINGGTFKCQTPNWTLNSHDTKKGTILVKGGTFYQFNPSDCTTEGTGTNFCAANYRAEADGEWYLVKEGCTLTVEKPVVTVQTEAAANAVTLNVVAPDGLTADEKAAYLGYFEKKITPNTEGGYTVELALKDELKPVIAETTADDTTKEAFVIDAKGNVTLNINNKKPGLYYGVQVLAELGADPVAVVPETNGSLLVPAKNLPDGNAAFFKVVVDFAPIVVPEAE